MEHVKGGGAAQEWDSMNTRSQRLMAAWFKNGETQVNKGKNIGVKMAEWAE